MMVARIIVCGGNGAGKSTLGANLAERLRCPFMDIEDYYFPRRKAGEPYAAPRAQEQAIAALLQDLRGQERFVFASVRGDYTPELERMFTCAIYLRVPRETRMERVYARSFGKFGERMLPGGDLYDSEQRFFDMVRNRSDARTESWLQTLSIPVITLDGTSPIAENAALILRALEERP